MIRPRKMKRLQLSVLKNDVNAVIAYIGRHRMMHFVAADNPAARSADYTRIQDLLEKVRSGSEFLGVALPAEPAPDSMLPTGEDEALTARLCQAIDVLKTREMEARQEKRRIEETLREAKAFANLNAPFAELDQLSYLTLRIGRLDPKFQDELQERLGDRAVIIPLGEEGGGRVLAASSRKGRFALDSELKNSSFERIAIPEGYQGVPAELLEGLERRLSNAEQGLENIIGEKSQMQAEVQEELQRLGSMLLMALAVEDLKSQLAATSSVYLLSGWVPADQVKRLTGDLLHITGGRIAIRAFAPDEVSAVRSGDEKIPVSLKHGPFAQGFEGMVISYGAPLYGTIDPTPLVAFFFTLLFGIMFGDVGHGFTLLLAGLLTGKHGPRRLARFKKYSTPLVAVGIASIVMGLLNGEVFTIGGLLIPPTQAITAAITGYPADRILTIMPVAEHGGSVTKLFYFFGFTIGIGSILNSLGLGINIVNKCIVKKFEQAFFSKTGLAGLLLFWYAVFIAVRIVLGGRFEYFDIAGMVIPGLCIFFGPVIWRCIARTRPVLPHGLTTFIVEGFVEILETASGYISSTVSFLRVGAFALSHAVLSFIVFSFTERLALAGSPIASVSALLVFIFGNLVIIVLEGMIVAIQAVRLQYYEFFSKFFTETGMEFAPFRFRINETQ
jgi:V/A-type H+-transporting ATPase subunit I